MGYVSLSTRDQYEGTDRRSIGGKGHRVSEVNQTAEASSADLVAGTSGDVGAGEAE